MNIKKFLISLVLAISILLVQVGGVFAAAGKQTLPITGTVQSITLETDSNTGITTIIVELISENQTGQSVQSVRVSQKTAEQLGLILLDVDGKPTINDFALGQPIEIKLTMVIPEHEEARHPVGNALEAFFSDIDGLDYKLIMDKHREGLGFGVLAQALWLTRQIGGDSDVFTKLVFAKQTGDFSEFDEYVLEDGTLPTNWGQFRQAILRANRNDNSSEIATPHQNNGNRNNKDKTKDKEKNNNGNGHGNGNGNGNGNNR